MSALGSVVSEPLAGPTIGRGGTHSPTNSTANRSARACMSTVAVDPLNAVANGDGRWSQPDSPPCGRSSGCYAPELTHGPLKSASYATRVCAPSSVTRPSTMAHVAGAALLSTVRLRALILRGPGRAFARSSSEPIKPALTPGSTNIARHGAARSSIGESSMRRATRSALARRLRPIADQSWTYSFYLTLRSKREITVSEMAMPKSPGTSDHLRVR